MSATGLDVFDRTLKVTNTWLNEIAEQVGPDKQRAYRALRAVLFALRDRLTAEEAAHLSSHLPLLVRGIFWEAYRPAHKPETYRTREEFLAAVERGLGEVQPMDPEACTRAVFAVLDRHVPPGEMGDVRQMLPGPVRSLTETSGRPA